MRQWFESREPREQWLIGIAAAMLVLVVAIQFILLPLGRAHSVAKAENLRAAQTLAIVSTRFQQADVAAGATQTLGEDAYRTTLVTTARARGLSVSRILSGPSGGVMIVMDEVAPQALFAWLAELDGANAIRPSQVVLSNNGSGLVRASIEFEEG